MTTTNLNSAFGAMEDDAGYTSPSDVASDVTKTGHIYVNDENRGNNKGDGRSYTNVPDNKADSTNMTRGVRTTRSEQACSTRLGPQKESFRTNKSDYSGQRNTSCFVLAE